MPSRIQNRAQKRQIVHVKVGPKRQDFGIHKNLICYHSPYFRAAFTSGFKETKTGVLKLPETDPAVFQLFYQWLYSGKLWDLKDPEEDWPAADDLFKLYVFADMTGIIRLKNQSLETAYRIIDMTGSIPTHVIPYLWENTMPNSLARRFMIDLVVWELGQDAFFEDPKSYPPDVRLEIMSAMQNLIGRLRTQDELGEIKSPFGEMTNYYEKVHLKLAESSHRTYETNPLLKVPLYKMW